MKVIRYKECMKSAWLMGGVGLTLSVVLGTSLFNLDLETLLKSVFASNIAGFIGLILTLRVEKIKWMKLNILNRSLKTWSLLAGVYLGILLALVPELRNWREIAVLTLPLIMSCGLMLFAFGPTQDWLVRRSQKR